MEKGYLPELINALTPAERNALRKYLHSPYHNLRSDVVTLFEYLLGKTAETPDRQQAHRRIFDGKPFDARQLNYTVSYLTKLVEDFLAQRAWDADIPVQHLQLIRELRNRGLSRLSERAFRSAGKQLEKQSRRDAAYFRQQYLLHYEELQGHLQLGRDRAVALETLTEMHDKAFICEKLKLGCILQNRQTVAARQFDAGFLPAVLDFLDQHPWLEEPAIAAWYHGYYIQSDAGATKNFEQLKALLFRHGDLLPDDERHDLILLSINFCIRRINSGDATFSRELFDLYREGLEQGTFLKNGVISRWSYNNIVNSALKLGEIDWAIHFLEDYRPRLEPAFRDPSYFFNLARCRYEKNDHPGALESLTRIEYDDILQNLSAKTLQMKIYYDAKAWQALDSLLDSTAIYMRRKKVLGYHRENFSNIVRFLQRLLALPPGNRAAAELLQNELMHCTVLTEKPWFLKKLEGKGLYKERV